ncbi:hypothetical protein [Burkholderia pseudomallei]|uniref:hypothetical protein n=1 Tax=Burkholderia pseudomallei TaxID=28450 RepID=UPI001D003732|nr:hypothetical protein [Burkholderia pseudomallei]
MTREALRSFSYSDENLGTIPDSHLGSGGAVSENAQLSLLSPVSDLDLTRDLLADLHDDLKGKVARFHQLADLSTVLGAVATMLPGGEISSFAWSEARTSFIHGNYVATVLLCQGLAEHVLAGYLSLSMGGAKLPDRISFQETLRRCVEESVIAKEDADDLRRLMGMRNPLSHFRHFDDPANLSRRVVETMQPAELHLSTDASFAISVVIRLLALPAFRVDR